MERIRLISFDGVIVAPPSVQYLDWFVPLLDKSIDESIFASPFIILQEGKLSVVDEFEVNMEVCAWCKSQCYVDTTAVDYTQSGVSTIPDASLDVTWVRRELCQQIEFCWPFVTRNPVGDMYNSLWAFDGSSVKVAHAQCFN